jgi:Fe2+ or Zn2+ uptake regulation protein
LQKSRAEIADLFAAHGLLCTSQRYAVFHYLASHPEHPTVEEVHTAINRIDPRASRATVYNSLRAMVDAGLVREITLGGAAARFESRIEPHHHFICDRCGRIQDLEWFETRDIAKKSGVQPSSVRELVLQGTCDACLPGRKAS